MRAHLPNLTGFQAEVACKVQRTGAVQNLAAVRLVIGQSRRTERRAPALREYETMAAQSWSSALRTPHAITDPLLRLSIIIWVLFLFLPFARSQSLSISTLAGN